MTRAPDALGRRALALYRDAPWQERAHVHVRWWSAPFRRLATLLPDDGPVLEIGCGHGLFSAYAALAGPGRRVVGVDIDADKVAVGAGAAARVPNLELTVAPDGAVPAGPWAAVVVVDVLYLLPADAQRRLLLAAAEQVAPGGRLVVKEMGTSPRWKVAWNRWQETLSVRVLRITEGSTTFTFVPPDVVAGWLRDAGLAVTATRLDAGRVHPHHVLVGERERA
ncbi:methyltransferase domain-containing protein [Cellulomonas sp. zg-ZUI22]|uniref:methyltransferase domain-containing protein n=1 Tax=Cellulomonas sp. zg-ZUI22 TaxID=2816955 RepID=UPI001A950F27|nr:methyltransferase domain-containing protein [Cellulomonas sp. zg-ZUI22]MBO0898983.1 methyltransferase domain-containing protein [Cellulomonas sp. zg-ZUI22]